MRLFWVVRFCLYLLASGLTIADGFQESTVSEFALWEQTGGDLDHLNGYIYSASSPNVKHHEAHRSLLATSALNRNKKPTLSNFLENLFRPVEEPNAQKLNTVEASTVNSTTGFKPIRINCGGKALTDAKGNEWSDDAYYNKGFKFMNLPSALAGAQDSSLYQTYRYNLGMFGEPLKYTFPIPNGEYEVVLYFPDKLSIAPNMRKFEVWIEDSLAFMSDEIADATQGTALSMTTDAIVSDENLEIKFDAITRYAYVSAIVVSALPPSAPFAPPAAPIAPPTAQIAPPTTQIGPTITPMAPLSAPIAAPTAPIAPHTAPIATPTTPIATPTAPIIPPMAQIAPPAAPIPPTTAPIAPPTASIAPPTAPILRPHLPLLCP